MGTTVKKDILFIETELLPEMVLDRYFCEPGSREFVEFDSANIEAMENYLDPLGFAFYRATVIIKFSGEPVTFHILIKLLPNDTIGDCSYNYLLAYDGFLNEEILWNKITRNYGKNYFPKFYLADMGKYGRPVIVIEDLEKNGYQRVLDRELNESEAKTIVDLIGRFHGKGMMLKNTNFPIFREYFNNLQEIIFAEKLKMITQEKFLSFKNEVKKRITDEKIMNIFEKLCNDSYEICKNSLVVNECENLQEITICQGFLLRENLWFKRDETKTDNLEVKILDWQYIRCGSNCIDLATILVQSKVDIWNDLVKSYIMAVQKEYPAISSSEFHKEIVGFGLHYALLILSLENSKLPHISHILSSLNL